MTYISALIVFAFGIAMIIFGKARNGSPGLSCALILSVSLTS
jgi:hypothetical protein